MATHLITGAGSGIGASVADLLHARGDTLVLLARSADRAREIAERYPGAQLRVSDLEHPELLGSVLDELPDRLDSVVHSAGVAELGTVEELDVEQWQRQLTVNVTACAEITKRALPSLRAARGTVVFVNSGSGLRAGPGWSAYAASKFGLRGLADALRAEEEANGVRVTGVHPGRVATAMQEHVHVHEGKDYDADAWIRPETVARVIVDVIDLSPDATIPEVVLRPTPKG